MMNRQTAELREVDGNQSDVSISSEAGTCSLDDLCHVSPEDGPLL